jgi:PAS domain-containing protein
MTLQMIQSVFGAAGAVIGVLTGLLSLFPTGRMWMAKAFRFLTTPIVAPWRVIRLEQRLIAVEYEVKPNSGGSMKDVQSRIADSVEKMSSRLEGYVERSEARYRHDFQTQRGPAFEIDTRGRATLVSFALGRLCRVDDAALELNRLAYLQFIEASERDEFLRTFRESAADGSMFRTQIRWYSRTHENRGLWDVRATPIDPKDSAERLYSAVLVPVDDEAKAIAERNGWRN